MAFTVGFPGTVVVNIGGKLPSTADAVSDSTVDVAAQLSEVEEGEKKAVSIGGGVLRGAKTESDGSAQSIAVQMLLKRMQELQEQLREQQQQLAAAQAAAYQSPEAKAMAVMSIQGQIVDTTGALAQVAVALVKELTKSASSGSLISTTA